MKSLTLDWTALLGPRLRLRLFFGQNIGSMTLGFSVISKDMSNRNESPSKPILVTAAIVTSGDQVLIARRKIDKSPESGKWEFPGGKLEFGESLHECLMREIREELNLQIEVGSICDAQSQVYLDRNLHIVLLFFQCRLISGELRLLDALDAKWVARSDLGDFDFAKADLSSGGKVEGRRILSRAIGVKRFDQICG